MEFFFKEDIHYIVEAWLILHNMMVEVQIKRDKDKNSNNYQVLATAHLQGEEGDALEAQEDNNALQPRQLTARERLDQMNHRWPQDAPNKEDLQVTIKAHFQSMKVNWYKLYNQAKHFELRDAIMATVNARDK
jgi:hypothetical protein